jgi:hypothetical protein
VGVWETEPFTGGGVPAAEPAVAATGGPAAGGGLGGATGGPATGDRVSDWWYSTGNWENQSEPAS